MRGITVSVDYGDLLGLTLARNAQHFFEIVVVTAAHDAETQAVVASVPNARLLVTDAFYRRGAKFNKGLALEEGFDVLGRQGWLTVLDADTLLPDHLRWEDQHLARGNLYVPPRRMLVDPARWQPELDWSQLPLRHEPREFPGYCQIFHADDPVLAARPWYGVNWVHAGGCDSVFQRRWAAAQKLWAAFDVLHLGEDGQNWFGRATRRIDGSLPPGAAQRITEMRAMRARRRLPGPRYQGEQLTEE